MKNILPIVALIAALMTGCLREGTDGCPACMSLEFTYGGTAEGFDSAIGNDIELQVFYDGVWHSARTIPYEQIAGGRKYSFKKNRQSQNVQLLAYTVPRGADRNVIPQCHDGLSFVEQGITMAESNRAASRCEHYADDLYSGALSVVESSTEESFHTVAMKDVFCRVDVVIENADLFLARFPDADPMIGIEGTAASTRSHDGSTAGDDMEVMADLYHYPESNRLATPVMRVLPAPDGRPTLSVNIYETPVRQSLPPFDSGEVAEAGKDITVTYRMSGDNNLTVTLTVNGWTVRTETIPLD